MTQTFDTFYPTSGKRLVLVVDDELINREIIANMLKEKYEVLKAPDGQTALTLIRENRALLKLILLDLMMPGMHGFDVLKVLQEDADLKSIPVIVMTADDTAELESLNLGAVDFIRKPLNQPDVALARITRTIEFNEDRSLIQSTQWDELTGAYTRDYFNRYAEQHDLYHPNQVMDALVVDVNHFHMINDRFGRAYGDEVLKRLGRNLQEVLSESDGIVCRKEADTFLIYCAHREDYASMLDQVGSNLHHESKQQA